MTLKGVTAAICLCPGLLFQKRFPGSCTGDEPTKHPNQTKDNSFRNHCILNGKTIHCCNCTCAIFLKSQREFFFATVFFSKEAGNCNCNDTSSPGTLKAVTAIPLYFQTVTFMRAVILKGIIDKTRKLHFKSSFPEASFSRRAKSIALVCGKSARTTETSLS